MSMIAMLIMAVVLGFFVVCALAMAPAYMEYYTVRDVLENVATDPQNEKASTSALRRRISNLFNTNRIESIKAGDVVLSRDNGELKINGNYEARVHLFSNVDAVMVFDDLVFTVGN